MLERASMVAQMVKNPPAVWESWVQSLGWEDLLKKGMATHSSILAWKIPWTEEPSRLQSMGLQRGLMVRLRKLKLTQNPFLPGDLDLTCLQRARD